MAGSMGVQTSAVRAANHKWLLEVLAHVPEPGDARGAALTCGALC